MIRIDGHNLTASKIADDNDTLTINGAYISLASRQIRTVENDNWYDAKHQRVMNAVYELEEALAAIVD